VLNASTSREIEAAFASLERDPADALYVPGALHNNPLLHKKSGGCTKT
jgi:hypothetical protein